MGRKFLKNIYVLIKKNIGLGNNNRHGNLSVANKYSNLKLNLQIPGYWQHGFYVDPFYFPEDELGFAKKYGLKLYIWNKQVERHLKKRLFYNYEIIGAPLIYEANELGSKSNEGKKLLYVPSHSLKQTKLEFDWIVSLRYLSGFSREGYEVTLLLYYLDYDEFILNNEFKIFCKENNIKVDTLGYTHEKNFLSKLIHYYLDYDIVGSEILSTSVVYGAFLGLKVFVAGPIKYVLVNTNADYYKKHIGNLNSMETYLNELNLYYQNLYPSLFVDPNNSQEQIEMGKEFLGYGYKLSKKEMKKEFGWNFLFITAIKTYMKIKQLSRNEKR